MDADTCMDLFDESTAISYGIHAIIERACFFFVLSFFDRKCMNR